MYSIAFHLIIDSTEKHLGFISYLLLYNQDITIP
jgi:hypothetical protein